MNFNYKQIITESFCDWYRIAVPGEVYPRIQLRIRELRYSKNPNLALTRPGEVLEGFFLIDETGWDGFREYEPQILKILPSYEEAIAEKDKLMSLV